MKFTLVYDGDLPASANKPRPIPASRIRNEFHHQLADLWDSHIILRELTSSARHPIIQTWYESPSQSAYLPWNPDYVDKRLPLEAGQIDLCEPIYVESAKSHYKTFSAPLSLSL